MAQKVARVQPEGQATGLVDARHTFTRTPLLADRFVACSVGYDALHPGFILALAMQMNRLPWRYPVSDLRYLSFFSPVLMLTDPGRHFVLVHLRARAATGCQ